MAYKWLTLNKNFDMTSWATDNNDIPNNQTIEDNT